MTNFMKTAALATALTFGAAAVHASGGFGFQTLVGDDTSITLDLVRSAEGGTVVIYDYTGGQFGAVLGSADLNAGVNADVIIQLENSTASELAAVIYDGEMSDPSMAVDWITLDVRDDS